MFVKTFRNFATQLISLAVSFGDRVVLAAILIRVWPTDLFADWATLTASASLLGLADLGFVIFLSNRLQKAFSQKDEAGFQRLIGFGVFMYGALALVMLAILVSLAVLEVVQPYLSIRLLKPTAAAVVLLLLGLAQILHSAKSALTQIYRGRGEFARGILIDSISASCIIFSAILAASHGTSASMLALVYIGAHLTFGWGILLTDIRRRYATVSLRPVLPRASELCDAGLAMRWYSLSYVLSSIWLQAPVLLLSALGLSGITVVTFVIHRTLVNFGRTFAVMLSMSAGIELTTHVHAGDSEQIKRGIAIVGRIVAAIGGVTTAGLLTFGGPIIHFWTGKSNLFDAAILFWLLVPAIAVAPAIPLFHLTHLADLPKPLAISQVVQTGLAVLLAILLIGNFGAPGVAFALAIGETVAVGFLLPFLVTRNLGIRYWRHAIGCLAVAIAALAWALSLAQGIVFLIGTDGAIKLVLAASFWACLTLPPVGYLVLPEQQQARLQKETRRIAVAISNRFF